MSAPSLLAKARGGRGGGGGYSETAGRARRPGGNDNRHDEHHVDEEADPLVPSSALPPASQTRVVAPTGARGGSGTGRYRNFRHSNAPASSSSTSSWMNPSCWRALVVVSVLAILHVSRQQQKTVSTYLRMNEELEHRFFAGGDGSGAGNFDPQRCVEQDVVLPASTTTATAASSLPPACRCVDPLLPMPRKFPKWLHRHEQLMEMASYAALDGVDVVVVGDSIIEHFSGTRDMGQQRPGPVDEGRLDGRQPTDGESNDNGDNLAELHSQAKAYATFAAHENLVALGCSGDTTNQLLFHLNYGILPPQLRPKMFVVAIGTNNLGSSGCNARTTLAGILQVAQYLHQQRPEAIIIVHGLFPRTDTRHEEGPLYRYWGQIVWINQQLKKFCSLHDEWRYFDANKHLLERQTDAPYKVALKTGLLPDGLHPSVEGYQVWSQQLSKFLAKVLSEDEDESKEDESDEDESKEDESNEDESKEGAREQGKKRTKQKGKRGHDRNH